MDEINAKKVSMVSVTSSDTETDQPSKTVSHEVTA